MIGVCFICARQAELVVDHHVCETCHDPARCRRFICIAARSPMTSYGTVKKRGGPVRPREDRPLTDQQRQAIQLLNAGHDNREVADQVGVFYKSVERWKRTAAFKAELAACSEAA
jgi:DNA-binding NarL/FixJ family response regulator